MRTPASPRRAAPAAVVTLTSALSLSVALSLSGCGGSSGLHTMGMEGVPSPALVGANLIFAEASLNGHAGGRLLVDTGSPVTLVNPALFPGATLPAQTQVKVNLGFGELTIDNVPVLELTGGSTMDELHLAGILGGDVMRQFSTALDYRAQQLRLGEGPGPTDVAQPGTQVAFDLVGGGVAQLAPGMSIVLPATRVPLTVAVDGTDHTFILDSGASEITVRSTLFATLVSDGRPQMEGFPITTAAGQTTGRITRARTVSVSGEVVPDPAILSAASVTDTLLDNISGEVKRTVDGLLGGTYLREFFVVVDYPHRTVRLQRYPTRDHISDELQRVGMSLAPDSTTGTMRVDAVYAGTDAAQKGVTVGDQVLTIDGQDLTPLDQISADSLLQGAVGATRQIGFGQTTSTTLDNAQVGLRVDDLVPPPGT